MKYRIQIAGWLASGMLSIGIGYLESALGYGYRLVYLGVLAIIIAIITYYITNMTGILEKVIKKQKCGLK